MQYLVRHIDCLSEDQDKVFIALSALHPLPPEEVLGLQWQDIDFRANMIYVRRAVTYPSRNQGMVGETKTEASRRAVSMVPQIQKHLRPGPPTHFVLGGEKPLSYTQLNCEASFPGFCRENPAHSPQNHKKTSHKVTGLWS